MARLPLTTGPKTPQEVFLSHTATDRRFVKRLSTELARHGVPNWFSTSSLLGADDWHDEIGAALKRCDWFAVVLSPSAVESMWVKRELLYALRDSRYEGRVLPILRRKCDIDALSWVLRTFQIVDMSKSSADAYRALFTIWGIGYRGTVSPPVLRPGAI